jgi:hypothetical protein
MDVILSDTLKTLGKSSALELAGRITAELAEAAAG